MDKRLFSDLTELLENHRRLTDSLNLVFSALENEGVDIINCIKKESLEDSQKNFDRLRLIQEHLSIAKYKFHYALSERLDRFVCDFDRDDEYSRKYWHRRIREDSFSPFE